MAASCNTSCASSQPDGAFANGSNISLRCEITVIERRPMDEAAFRLKGLCAGGTPTMNGAMQDQLPQLKERTGSSFSPVSMLIAAGVGLFVATPASAEPRAVIELFTSQGCSSCPDADKLLGELAQDPTVIALSLPIDYWDYLAWKDTLADPTLHRAPEGLFADARRPSRSTRRKSSSTASSMPWAATAAASSVRSTTAPENTA